MSCTVKKREGIFIIKMKIRVIPVSEGEGFGSERGTKGFMRSREVHSPLNDDDMVFALQLNCIHRLHTFWLHMNTVFHNELLEGIMPSGRGCNDSSQCSVQVFPWVEWLVVVFTFRVSIELLNVISPVCPFT